MRLAVSLAPCPWGFWQDGCAPLPKATAVRALTAPLLSPGVMTLFTLAQSRALGGVGIAPLACLVGKGRGCRKGHCTLSVFRNLPDLHNSLLVKCFSVSSVSTLSPSCGVRTPASASRPCHSLAVGLGTSFLTACQPGGGVWAFPVPLRRVLTSGAGSSRLAGA